MSNSETDILDKTLKNWRSMVRWENKAINLQNISDAPTLKKTTMASKQETKMCTCNQYYCCTKAIFPL